MSRGGFDARRLLAAALARGLERPEFTGSFGPGTVVSLKDEAIDFPTDRLPNAGARTVHDFRRAIILQVREWANANRPVTLLVVPCSASHRGDVGAWDVRIPDGTAGFTKPSIVAYTSLIQPVLKSDVEAIHGNLDAATLLLLVRTLSRLLDLADR
jgi:hypothetical protein